MQLSTSVKFTRNQPASPRQMKTPAPGEARLPAGPVDRAILSDEARSQAAPRFQEAKPGQPWTREFEGDGYEKERRQNLEWATLSNKLNKLGFKKGPYTSGQIAKILQYKGDPHRIDRYLEDFAKAGHDESRLKSELLQVGNYYQNGGKSELPEGLEQYFSRNPNSLTDAAPSGVKVSQVRQTPRGVSQGVSERDYRRTLEHDGSFTRELGKAKRESGAFHHPLSLGGLSNALAAGVRKEDLERYRSQLQQRGVTDPFEIQDELAQIRRFYQDGGESTLPPHLAKIFAAPMDRSGAPGKFVAAASLKAPLDALLGR